MRVVFQIDPIQGLKAKTDTSLLIMQGAIRRGFDVWFYYPYTLFYKENKVYAKGYKFNGKQEEGNIELLNLDTFDFLFLRQDPPFDMQYITTTYLLEKLQKCKVLNNPASVRNSPEKLFVLNFPEFIPPTIISNDEKYIREFWRQQKEVVIKPLYGHGGAGVFYIPYNDKNLFNVYRLLKEKNENLPIIAQKYLSSVMLGDKRIVFINGEFAGALNRIQSTDFAISNVAAGGAYEKTDLTSTEKKMCDVLGPVFKQMGLFLVGIDVIDNMLTEINVTSPTGFAIINEIYNIRIEEKILDALATL